MFLNLFKNAKIRGTIALVLAKFWMTLASIGIAINLILVLTLMQMAPKLKVIAQILSNPENPMMNTMQHIQIDTLPMRGLLSSHSEINKTNRKLLDEMLVRYYLDMRYSLFADEREMRFRWAPGGVIHRLSSPAVYKKFAPHKDEFKKIKGLNYSISVDILSITSLDNTYTVEFNLYTFYPHEPNEKPTVQRRVANFEIGHRRNVHIYNRIASNPFGFYVKTFNETTKIK